jgi:hypothetical protein
MEMRSTPTPMMPMREYEALEREKNDLLSKLVAVVKSQNDALEKTNRQLSTQCASLEKENVVLSQKVSPPFFRVNQ